MLETLEEVRLLPGLLSGGWVPLEGSSMFVDIEVKLFGTSCVAVLLCGSDSRFIVRDMEGGISAFAASCCRVVFEIGRVGRVSNEAICNLASTVLLVAGVGTRRLNFLGHVLCVPDGKPVKECAIFMHGRARTLWLQCAI